MSIAQIKMLIIWALLLISGRVLTQNNDVINQLVTCNFVDQKAHVVFAELSRQSGCLFSYSGDFNKNRLVTLYAKNEALKSIVNRLGEAINADIIVNKQYLIVRAKPEIKELYITGTIYEIHNDEPLRDATIYIKKLKAVVNTGSDGKFAIKIPNNQRKYELQIAKQNFHDTVVVFVANKSQQISVKMSQIPKERIEDLPPLESNIITAVVKDSLTALPLNFAIWANLEKDNSSIINIKDTLLSPLSISLIPPISSNKLLALNTKNSIALNIIGGYSKGIDIMEIGGVYNLDNGDVKYIQLAGVANIVAGNTTGVQVGGVVNLVRGEVRGLQTSGVMNIVSDMKGVQVGGFSNVTLEQSTGLQVAGAFQRTKYLKGLQIAGVYNDAKIVKGVQISGFLNRVDTLTGVQIGILNVANDYQFGVPIGLFNYVRNGYHKLEMSYDDLGFFGMGFRSGVNLFHTYFKLGGRVKGIAPKDVEDVRLLQARYGIGSSMGLTKKFRLDLDLSSGSLMDKNKLFYSELNVHNQFLLGFSYQFSKRFGIRSGVTVNHMLYKKNSAIATDIEDLVSNEIYNYQGLRTNHKMWLGYQVSVLLF